MVKKNLSNKFIYIDNLEKIYKYINVVKNIFTISILKFSKDGSYYKLYDILLDDE